MNVISLAASTLDCTFNYALHLLELFLRCNNSFVSFLLSSLRWTGNHVLQFFCTVLLSLQILSTELFTFLSELGSFVIWTLVTVGHILKLLADYVQSFFSSILHVLTLIGSYAKLAYDFILYCIITFLDAIQYSVVLIISSIILLLQAIPNSFIFLWKSLLFVVVNSGGLLVSIYFFLKTLITNSFCTVITSILGVPLKAYVGLVILIIFYLKRRKIVHLLKQGLVALSFLLIVLFLKISDGSLFIARIPGKIFKCVKELFRATHHSNIYNTASDNAEWRTSVINWFLRYAKLEEIKVNQALPSVQNLMQQLNDEKDKRKCIICQDNERNIILLPCKHMCICSNCLTSLQRYDHPHCPLCRSNITTILNVFI